MSNRSSDRWSRREFLTTVAAAGTGAVLGFSSEAITAEPPLETTKLRLAQISSICYAPQYMAEDILRNEGFAEVQYVKFTSGDAVTKALAAGEINLTMTVVGSLIIRLDAGDPIVILGGVHVGCYELFGTNGVRAIRDLKGKTVAVVAMGSGQHVFLSSMLSYVGLDPRREINWVTHPSAEAMELLSKGKVDAFMAFPPEPQELRAKKIGRVVVNTMMDRPWSQYFCCMVAANKEFARKNPVATKRALRAILKMTDLVALDPERAARFLVDKGYTKNFNYALEAMKDIPYNKWREYDPEDTMRFYSLRLQEVGMIKSSPQKIIAQGTDWRFLKELKKELKT